MSDEIERALRVVGEAHSWEQRCDSDDLMRNTYEPLLEVLRWSCAMQHEAASTSHGSAFRHSQALSAWRTSLDRAVAALREALPKEEE